MLAEFDDGGMRVNLALRRRITAYTRLGELFPLAFDRPACKRIRRRRLSAPHRHFGRILEKKPRRFFAGGQSGILEETAMRMYDNILKKRKGKR